MKVRKICRFKSQQQGVILIIALILMVVIALGTVASMRLSGSDELVNNNTRSRVLAMQAANSAIVTCRTGVFNTAANWNVQTSTDEGTLWEDDSNWTASNITVVSAGFGGYAPAIQPQCMIEDITEYMKTTTDKEHIVAYRITAKGFSPNYTEDSSGIQIRGSQAWQQIIVGRTLK